MRILRPQGARRPLAVIVYLHGAGRVFGNHHHTHDRLIGELAVGAQATVVFPNDSLSPEAKYPTAIQEGYAVAKWVAEVTLLAKQRRSGVPPAGARYPVTDANFETESYRQFATAYYLRRDGMQWYWDQYTTDPPSGPSPPPPGCAPASSSSLACRLPWHHCRS